MNNLKSSMNGGGAAAAKELIPNGHSLFEKDPEIRKYKNEIRELKSKLDIMTMEVRRITKKSSSAWIKSISNFDILQMSSKTRENQNYKQELINLSAELNNLRNEIVARDKQMSPLNSASISSDEVKQDEFLIIQMDFGFLILMCTNLKGQCIWEANSRA